MFERRTLMQPDERILAVTDKPTDDALTLASLGIVAFVIAIVTHEGLGHGLATLAVGGKPVMLTTVRHEGAKEDSCTEKTSSGRAAREMRAGLSNPHYRM
jgi:hypothetical protein